jgi:hypothetical protein
MDGLGSFNDRVFILGAVPDYRRRLGMSDEQRFEEMIKAGWNVVARDLHEIAILKWRKRSCEFLSEMLGPEHSYTLNLGDKASKASAMCILSGLGVLCAAKESMFHERTSLGSAVNM